jgi:hypothetical protein
MSNRTKIILQILLFFLAVLALAWAIWVVFFRATGDSVIPKFIEERVREGLPKIGEGPSGVVIDETPGPTTLVPEPPSPVAEPDSVASGGRTLVEALVPSRVEFSTLTSSGNFHYYNPNDGRFYKISETGGEPVLLSTERFPFLYGATWSNSGNLAVLEQADGSNVIYNFASGRQQASLPKASQEYSFSPDERSIAYEYVPANYDDRWIVVSDTNGQRQQLIEPIGREAHNVQTFWSPNNQVVATYREPTSSYGEEVFFIGFNNENFLSLQTNGYGFQGAWSPTGKQILYSVFNESTNYNPVLHVAGAEGDNIGLNNRSLGISTWPDKCAFASDDILYCAVPQYLEAGSGIFPESAQTSSDIIYQINLSTNSVSPLAFPETERTKSFTITGMTLSSDGSELYYTDRVSGFIYRLRIR